MSDLLKLAERYERTGLYWAAEGMRNDVLDARSAAKAASCFTVAERLRSLATKQDQTP